MPEDFALFESGYSNLAHNFHVNPLSCENPNHYESYIQYDALGDMVSGRGTTHVLLRTDEFGNPIDIEGFITLRANSLNIESEGNVLGNPALEISELAVSKKYERQGVGTKLVSIAILLAERLSKTLLGIRYIVLCADHAAVDFYKKLDPPFDETAQYYTIPKEGWNVDCVQMLLKLNEFNS